MHTKFLLYPRVQCKSQILTMRKKPNGCISIISPAWKDLKARPKERRKEERGRKERKEGKGRPHGNVDNSNTLSFLSMKIV